MSIPSALLVEDIKFYESYHGKPYKKGDGIFIGYGHNLWHDPSPVTHLDGDLAYAIRHFAGERKDTLTKCIMETHVTIDKNKAEEILHTDLIRHHDILTEYSSAFRHVTNKCKNAFYLPQSTLAKTLNQLEETNLHSTNEILATGKVLTQNAILDDEIQSDTQLEKLKKGRKKLLKNLLPEEYESHDKAMIRTDALIHLSYLTGAEKLIQWKAVLSAILVDKYDDAASAMLNSRLSKELGKRMAILSQRIRHGIWV